jgi:hypothetical protein
MITVVRDRQVLSFTSPEKRGIIDYTSHECGVTEI